MAADTKGDDEGVEVAIEDNSPAEDSPLVFLTLVEATDEVCIFSVTEPIALSTIGLMLFKLFGVSCSRTGDDLKGQKHLFHILTTI